ncbi:MAG: hypothetical protein A2790_06455 [Phenylobacterium sp. RIFCSPHIGHO2_01_FULL_69_31]|jgi:hypothetical protein|uniref:hypothetical protein n=1 Tax=Phenylobacterium sp. RIFCSPHIGHO2_01_FULL_69_31 TaxID=1801944 RepID=UPI0008AF5136|nr:hypothetical protein [Phenylobacterium sp. RIFCSPHIGHO2_01_FULL_69_31]OHB29558.1 MAG: hypothetical protein A2790_06455 [Phenylobacterium sp. RIFCSPHIGHO2_01_FULL_69_31]
MSDAPQPYIYLAVPCYGGQLTLHFVSSLLKLQEACRERGVGLHVDMMGGEALITRGRSRLAAQFLSHPQATHILYIDADIGFRPENVFRLLDADKDVIAAVCPLKKIDWEKVRTAAKAGASDLQAAGIGYVVRFLPTPDKSVEVNDGFARVAYGGTGFLMISRGAMQRIVDAHPELRAKMGDMADNQAPEAVMVFDTMIEPETGQYLSEDYAFCRRWRDLGGEIWADFEARLTHVGHAAYTGSLMQALRGG